MDIRAFTAVAAVLAMWAPAGADAARSTGKIAYIKGNISVRAVNADGTIDKGFAPVRSGAQGSPVWSPDGRRLLFHRDQPHALVTVTPGRGRWNVLYEGADEIDDAPAEYAWSASGRLIAFTHGLTFRLSVTQADGSGGTRELPVGENVGGLSWLPDDRRIAFLRADAMWTYDVITGAEAKLFDVGPTDANYHLSPNGQMFVFDRGASPRLWVRRVDGSGERAVLRRTGAFAGTWSPDGRELAFLLRRGGRGPIDIYKVRVDGSGLKRVTRHGNVNVAGAHWGRGSLRRRDRL